MKKIITILFIVLFASNCGIFSRFKAKITGESVECYEGVRYIQFTSGVAVAVNLDGKPLPCK